MKNYQIWTGDNLGGAIGRLGVGGGKKQIKRDMSNSPPLFPPSLSLKTMIIREGCGQKEGK